jgi:ketosteroid isomerase-like protein
VTAGDEEAVRAANAAFYAAFEARDLAAMERVWDTSDAAVCTHPGWATLRGWAEVRESWRVLFANEQRLQFIITNEHVAGHGPVAWVTCDENLIDGAATGTVSCVNVFVRDPSGPWRVVMHHGGPVLQSR